MPVLTVRLTTELYADFKKLALARYQSMNKLAVQLLHQAVREADQQVETLQKNSSQRN